MHIVMDYCEGGDLAGQIGAKAKAESFFEEKQILDWSVHDGDGDLAHCTITHSN